jgi:hypothetical protein
MKKHLPTGDIANELAGSSAFFRAPEPKNIDKPEPSQTPSPETQVPKSKETQTTYPSSPPPKTKTDPPHQLIDRPINQLINHPNTHLMQKPVGFYISPQLDDRLDAAVRYYKVRHGFRKVDRSVVLNALLESGENWTDQALDLLVSRVINILTRKLTG